MTKKAIPPASTPARAPVAVWDGFSTVPADPAAPDPRWSQFADAHRGHPALEQETIYALPERLIDAICEEMKRPPKKVFLDGSEEKFERDLSNVAGGGFFLKRRIAYSPLTSAPAEEEPPALDELTRTQREDGRRIRGYLNDSMKEDGRTDLEIQEYWAEEDRMKRKIDALKWGYAGWLVTNPRFHEDVKEFRLHWGCKAVEVGLPSIPMSFTGEPPQPPKEGYEEFYTAYVWFCQVWGLRRLATWDLPVPLLPELLTPTLQYLPATAPAGVTVFAPWYLLRAKDISLYKVAAHKRTFEAPQHLNDWLNKKTGKFGPERFARMLLLYIYLELALNRRYPGRLKDRLDKIHNAFGGFFCKDSDNPDGPINMGYNVEKDRKEMNKRLRSTAEQNEERDSTND